MRDLAFVTETAEPATAPPLLSIKAAQFRTGGRVLIDIVRFDVPAGAATVILGENGAGKSLLLRLMHGLITPNRGTILWHGRPLDRVARRAQAMVFQRPVLLRRSVSANIAFALKHTDLARTARREAEVRALRAARLDHLADAPARLLSGGEQQRLALARALATNPELLFLDEPTANLDPASTLAIEEQVASARERGVTVVWVTHDAGQARRIGGHGVFLHRGRIAERRPIPELLDDARSAPARAWAEGRLFCRSGLGTLCTTSWAATLLTASATIAAAEDFIILQSTTSTENSGLFEHILPSFEAMSGIDVRVVAVGTGQAIRNAANGDGDVLLVHAKSAEEAFVATGHGVERHDVMYNDFVIVGPADDPAGIEGSLDAPIALSKIATARAPFVSRGDDSGTHKAEMRLWTEAGVDAAAASGTWYRETGSGMGATLNTGIGMGAYIMTDRATWISFGNKGDHRVLVEGDARLFNQYGVILVNPERHENVKAELGQRFITWLLSPDGQDEIAKFRIDGQQLFFPNAGP